MFLAKWLTTNMAKVKSGFIFTIENISNLVISLYYFYLVFLALGPLFERCMTFFIKLLHSLTKLKWYFEKILLI